MEESLGKPIYIAELKTMAEKGISVFLGVWKEIEEED